MIESRTYQTIAGPWTYYTVDDGQFDVADDESCLMIGTLESYEKMCAYFEAGKMVPVYIEVPDGIRLLRPSNARKTRKGRIIGNLPEIPCRRKRFFRGKSGTPGNYEEISEHGYGNVRGRILRDLDK